MKPIHPHTVPILPPEPLHSHGYTIAIIGGGPKGTYALERLLAELKAAPPQNQVDIHVYNRSEHFGSGDIYRTDQPHYLLMNVPKHKINMWLEEEPPAVVPQPIALAEWVHQQEIDLNEFPSTDYLPRAVVGAYLQDGFQQLLSHLPPGVSCRPLVGEVTQLHRFGNGFRLSRQLPDGTSSCLPICYQQVLLATGHPLHACGRGDATYRQVKDHSGASRFIKPVYPVSHLKDIPRAAKVAVKGIGLTFIDTVLALTEGRGGRFIKDTATGDLRYMPSGEEPAVIYPFSRSAVPMIPRSVQETTTALRFITEENLLQLTAGKIDFKTVWWPLLEAEYKWAYYLPELQQFMPQLAEGEAPSIPELEESIEEIHVKKPDLPRFDLDQWLSPLADRENIEPEALHAFMLEYIADHVVAMKKGSAYHRLSALTSVWSRASGIFRLHYNFGGLQAESQRFFDQQLAGKLNRVSYGPPLINMEKVLALAQCGLIQFRIGTSPEVTIDRKHAGFRIHSQQTEEAVSVGYLIDARIPRPDLAGNQEGLYAELLQRRLITPFVNRSDGQRPYQPGCLHLNDRGFVRLPTGEWSTQLAATGTPTEGITFDNDSLFRQVNNTVSGWAKQVRQSIKKGALVNTPL